MTRKGNRVADLMRQRDQEQANGHVQADPPPAAPAEPPEPTDDELRQGSEHDRRMREKYGAKAGDAADTAPAVMVPPASIQAAGGWKPDLISSDQFDAADYPLTWLVKRLLVQGQPAILGGPQKSLKTSMAIDLAVSLASGKPFLDTFEVYQPVRVALISGESGQATIRDTARCVSMAKRTDLKALGESFWWGFQLPRIGVPEELTALCCWLREQGVQVIVIDPLYLCLLDGQTDIQAANVFQMGPLLRRMASSFLNAGCTPILVHHTNRSASRMYEPPQLHDLAFAGSPEFARQWLLVNRREPFAPGEPHRLWLSGGGSAGQCGLWAADIDLGNLGDDLTGRIWDVQVRPAHEEQERRRADKDRKKREDEQQREQEDDRKFMEALDALDRDGTGASLNRIRTDAHLSGDMVARAAQRLTASGLIEAISGFRSKGGNGAGVPSTGYRRVRDHRGLRNDRPALSVETPGQNTRTACCPGDGQHTLGQAAYRGRPSVRVCVPPRTPADHPRGSRLSGCSSYSRGQINVEGIHHGIAGTEA